MELEVNGSISICKYSLSSGLRNSYIQDIELLMVQMKNEENNKITIQDWLSCLSSQKEIAVSIHQSFISIAISFGALFIASLLTSLQIYPYNVIGVVGLIISFIYIIYILNALGKNTKDIGKINKIQFYILEGNLRDVEEIVEAYLSEFPT
jgi:hypothetical protein